MNKQISLDEISEDICPGFACRPSQDNSGMLQLRPYSITTEGKIDMSQSKYVKCDNVRFAKYKLVDGDILFNNTNSPELVGKTALFKNNQGCVFSNHLTRIRIKRNLADPGYIARYLHNLFSTKVFYTRCQQWVNQAAIPKTELSKLSIPLPPLTVQRKAASILEKTESAREKRKEANRLTDEFLKSTFLELFGDPVRNEKKWSKKKLGDLTLRITKGESPKWQGFDYQKDGVRFITSENVLWGEIDSNKVKFIPNKFHEKLFRSQLQPEDLLINLVGASIGRSGLVSKDILPANINQAVSVITLNKEILNPIFMLCQVINKSIQALLLGSSVDAARANISLTDIRELMVIVPPISKQQNFADLVQKVEKLKAKQRESEKELNNLFNSLMQKAFTGKLVL